MVNGCGAGALSDVQQFADRAVRFIDRGIGMRACRGVGIRNGDAPDALSADDTGPLVVLPLKFARNM